MKYTKNLPIELEVVENTTKEEDGILAMPVRYNVEGIMKIIKQSQPSKDKQDMLDEYAKFYILKKLGVKTYPLEKKI